MPINALRVCSHPGCPELVIRGYCEKHERKPFETANSQRPEWQHLYNSSRWLAIRKYQLIKDPWCAECLKNGQHIFATECDHINPHRGDANKFFGGPFQSLCKSCHSRKTLSEVLGRGA